MTENNKFDELVERAKTGDAGAQYCVGLALALNENPDCMEWLHKAYENGYRDAAYKIGDLYYRGKLVQQNYEEALKWYHIAAEEESEDGASVLLDIAVMYINGYGVSKDMDEANKWLLKGCQKASRLGCSGEQFTIAYYTVGLCLDAEDDSDAVQWMTKAADGGHTEAKLWLAKYYSKDERTAEEHEKAHKLYLDVIENRAENGLNDEDYKSAVDGIARLAHFRLQKFEESIKWWRTLKDLKEPYGYFMLAMCYLNGWGTAPSFQVAGAIAKELELLDSKLADDLWAKMGESVLSSSTQTSSSQSQKSGGCYVATAVYGSYDCPEVWTLRRFRDYTLDETWYGRAFIKVYYAVSPTLVKWFGETKWFQRLWKGKLDRLVARLQSEGVESTPYQDKKYR